MDFEVELVLSFRGTQEMPQDSRYFRRVRCQHILRVTASTGLYGATIRAMAVMKDKELHGSDVIYELVLKVSSSSNSSVCVCVISDSCRLPLLVVLLIVLTCPIKLIAHICGGVAVGSFQQQLSDKIRTMVFVSLK